MGHSIVLSGVSGAGMLKHHQHNAAVRNTVQSPNGVSMWVNIETALVECHVFAQSMQETRL